MLTVANDDACQIHDQDQDQDQPPLSPPLLSPTVIGAALHALPNPLLTAKSEDDMNPYIAPSTEQNCCLGFESLGDTLPSFDREKLIHRIEMHKQGLFLAQQDLVESLFSVGQQLHILTEVALGSSIVSSEKQLSEQLANIEMLEDSHETTRRRLHALVQQVFSSFKAFLDSDDKSTCQ
ncbi:hypothetical protein BASA50_008574 [Batrachochytrium salamandrivorans]|uniref:Uncharacterized protein n=1 Tax=Batrachochytrium salamandrivorans TaxID=1357716 RepID=A0ABQ8F3P9_9FUNG|nr:hypothetical protein BASA62_010291 [Batrachochytrium salamandrivorans]KAH6571890.1 hypothetical protein BASA60_006934 [Batrachochytrium salamandrivorans]KAH6591587.1 hypothetical protein BASA50_008561 [Batrachochytrium salamandrivorans]KAH6591600.1 hypothetical protein BASA50_008574 [Batrachochytrium salamandrivorans]KAH6593772.1 hypothetical protein BASA61_004162 [Batrachochytrium salamandrivorans]